MFVVLTKDAIKTYSRHCIGSGLALCSVVEELNERIVCVRIQEAVHITESEADGDHHNETDNSIDSHARNNGMR